MTAKKDRRPCLPEEIYTVKIRRDAVTGVAVFERWEKDGILHREDGPASIGRDAVTGVVVHESWFRNNESHRPDGPATILRKPDGRVYYTDWYRNGEKIAAPKAARKAPRAGLGQRSSLSLGPTG